MDRCKSRRFGDRNVLHNMEGIKHQLTALVVLACIGLSFSKPAQKEAAKECKEPIGIQTGFLETRDIKTSTAQKNFTVSDAWCSTQNNDKQFFAVDLGEDFLFTKVATQGKVDDMNRFVKSYELQFSSDNKDWKTYLDGKKSVLEGNKDTFTVKYHKFSPDTIGRYVKLLPKSWNNGICSRMELYGCAVEDLQKAHSSGKSKTKEPEKVPVVALEQAAIQTPAQTAVQAPAPQAAQANVQTPDQTADIKDIVPDAVNANAKEVPKRDSEANWNFIASAGNNDAADNADLLELSRQLGTPAQR